MTDFFVTINAVSPFVASSYFWIRYMLEPLRITNNSFYCICCFPEHIVECYHCMEQLFSFFYSEEFGGGRRDEEGLWSKFQKRK